MGTHLCIVSRYLLNKGFYMNPVFYMDSEIFIGWRVITDKFEIVYRFYSGKLLICNFSTTGKNSDCIFELKKFIKLILRNVSGVNYVCAVKSVSGSFLEMSKRERLFELFMSWGATYTDEQMYIMKVDRKKYEFN